MNKTASIIPGTLIALTALSGFLLSAPYASAEKSGTITLNLEVPADCSLTINQTAHSATVNSGSDATIGTSTIKSICNDPGGLAVYAAGYTNDSYGNNNLTATINGSTYNIPSATDQAPDSQWNMTLAAVSGTYAPSIVAGYTSASVVPQQYTKVAYRNSMTDSGTGATGANFTAAFNIHVALDQPAGTYTGKVKFLLVHPNVLTWDNGVPDDVQPSTLDRDPEATTPSLQDWDGCNAMAANETTTLTDSRDGTEYTIAKLGSQCWMTENLRLDFSSPTFQAQSISDLESATNNPATGFITAAKATNPSDTSLTRNNVESVAYSTTNIGQSDCPLGNCDVYGVYYNYYTISAGWGTENYSGVVPGDLCPTGWHLPTEGSATDDFSVLNNAINSGSTSSDAGLIASPANFVYSGQNYYDEQWGPGDTRRGENGQYWSSWSADSTYALMLYFSSSSVYPDGRAPGTKFVGMPARCVANPSS